MVEFYIKIEEFDQNVNYTLLSIQAMILTVWIEAIRNIHITTFVTYWM
ncbi:MAG: hypothetical protein GY739_17025 [Mesoflavibacter sp.]|nr:hypothetical protein [Mesoflavibacter sp.]